LASTPGAETTRSASSFAVNASAPAIGASLTAATVRLTVATFESAEPSLAR
jgi:hypothetical protein